MRNTKGRPLGRLFHLEHGMGLRRSTYRRAFGLHHWTLTNGAWDAYERMLESQWWSRQRMEEYQVARLNDLFRHCHETRNFYASRVPQRINSLDELGRIEPVSKADLTAALNSGKFPGAFPGGTTGGSTGVAFRFMMTPHSLDLRWGATMRGHEWTGYRFGEPCARLWHSTLGMTVKQAAKEMLDAIWSNRRFYPVFKMDDANMRKFIRQIQKARPTLIEGYAEALNVLARFIEQSEHRSLYDAGVKAVLSSAQTLEPETASLIERAFGCRVFNKYGAREFSGIAYQCDRVGPMHVVNESYVVEVVNPDENGDGDVLVTDIQNTAMPFIRYRLGDIVRMGNGVCSCGRETQTIEKVVGRKPTVIIGANGVRMPGTYFPHYFKDFPEIDQFQVVQTMPGSVAINLVLSGNAVAVCRKIRAEIASQLGMEQPCVAVRAVDEIKLTKVGKKPQAVIGFYDEKAA